MSATTTTTMTTAMRATASTALPKDLGQVARGWAEAEDFAATAAAVVRTVGEVVPSTDIGITVIGRGGRLSTVAATTGEVTVADQDQYDLGEGPCVEAAVGSLVLWAADLAVDPRWPTWGQRAARLGLRSILSVGLAVGDRRLGGLNVYGRTHGAFDAETADDLRELAQHAALALGHARQVEDLQIALSTRTLIGQAQGVLMERHSLDSEQAFAVLRRYSQHHNVKLRALAQTLIATGDLPDHSGPDRTPR